MNEKFRALLVKHCNWLDDSVRTIDSNLDVIGRNDPARADAADETITLVHQMNGTSGAMGYAELSQAAAQLEKKLECLCADSGRHDLEMLDEAIDLFKQLKVIAEAASPETSSLYNANLG